jgi:hypothetical protein
MHYNFGHPDAEFICRAISGNNPTWKVDPSLDITPAHVRKVLRKHQCAHCLLAKRNLMSPSKLPHDHAHLKPGEIVYADPSGPISPPTREGHRWFTLFVDAATNHMLVYTHKTRDGFEWAYQETIKYYKARGYNPKILRTDNDTVADSLSMEEALVDFQMTHEHSAPYRQFQNGKVERHMQTVCKGVSLLLHSQPWIQADQWNLALHHFVDCRNHTINSTHKFKTPDHRINGKPLDLRRKFQFAFGDLVAAGIPEDLRSWKFDLRNDIGIYVGQPVGMVHSSYVYYPGTGNVLARGSIRKLELDETKVLQYFQRRQNILERSLRPQAFFDALGQLIPPEQIQYDFSVPFDTPATDTSLPEPQRLSAPLFDTVPPQLQQSKKRTRQTTVQSDMHLRSRPLGALAATTTAIADTSIREHPTDIHSHYSAAVRAYAAKITSKRALRDTDRQQWLDAIRKEVIENLFEGGTLVEEVPTGTYGIDYKVIHSTMQLKIKLRDDMTIEKYKARLCARGDMLSGLIDETYSPTISSLAHSVAHQLAILDDMHTCSVDVVAAYLYEDYPSTAKPLYIKLEPHIAEALGLDPSTLYRVKKYLYGLPDSGRAYYRGYSAHLEAHGYKRTVSDPCMFVKLNNGERTYVWIHVDDTFVASTSTHELQEFQRIIGLRYKYTVQHDIESFLGVHISKLPDGKSVKLTQPKLLAELFAEYLPSEMPGTSRVRAPQSNTDPDTWDPTPIERVMYLHLLGALIYVTKSRPDIATAVSFAATHAVKPTKGAYQELLRCVQYLWNTQEAGLVLHTGTPGAELKLKCYVDASYLTHGDSKSHTGYCLSFGDIGVFYAKSSKQTLVTTSSTHAEMRALYQLILEIVYVVNLCEEMGRPVSLPAIVLEDNQPVIDLSKDLTKLSKKCKHFLMLVNYVREQVASGLVAITKVPTEDNLADILTKILAGSEFVEKAEHLLGMQFSTKLDSLIA